MDSENVKRSFIPGERWIYFKLYMGYTITDVFLCEKMPQIVSELKDKRLIKKWFFIRYSDPEHHLRIRFETSEMQYFQKIVEIINQHLKKYIIDELIWNVQIDTYHRELERYGQNIIETAENIFFYDSECIITLLKLLEYESDDKKRWLSSIKLIENFFDLFGLTIEQRQKFCSVSSEGYKSEFEFKDKSSRLQLSKKYREHKKSISMIMDAPEEMEWAFEILTTIKERSKSLMPVAKILEKMNAEGKLLVSIADLLKTFIHMTINRMFRSKQRLYELVLFDMLTQYYNSVNAKIKYNVE